MTNGLTVCIRYHRGSFNESMQTTNEFCCIGRAKIAIGLEYKVPVERIEITHQIWDERLKSDSFIITIEDDAIGHLWYKPEVTE